MRQLLVAFVLFVSAGLAPATEFYVPPQKIVVTDGNDVVPAGKSIALGEMVDISVTKPELPSPYLTSTSYTWKVLEAGKERKFKTDSANPANVWYAAGIKPKRQQVFVVVTHLFVVRGEKNDPKDPVTEIATKTQFLYAEIVIGNPEPEPGPGPGPKPSPVDPDPTFPDGKFKLAAYAYEQGKQHVPADAKKVAKPLAEAYRAVARKFRDAKDKPTREMFLQEAKAASDKVMADAKVDPKKWDEFAANLQEKLYNLQFANPGLKSVADFCDALDEVALGLEVVS